MNEKATEKTTDKARTFSPKLAFYHATARGTGSVASFELLPAQGDAAGSIHLKLARQSAVADRSGAQPTAARFDWENALVVKLSFSDLCQMLLVLRGVCESVADGKGLYHASARAQTMIRFRHQASPVSGYSLDVSRKTLATGDESRANILFSEAEAIGLCETIAGSMALVSFGVPCRSVRDDVAA